MMIDTIRIGNFTDSKNKLPRFVKTNQTPSLLTIKKTNDNHSNYTKKIIYSCQKGKLGATNVSPG